MWKAVVKGFAGIFFEMEARDADALFFTVDFDFEPAAGGQGQFVFARSGSPWASLDRNNFCAQNVSAREQCN